jgi:hypothetical protein
MNTVLFAAHLAATGVMTGVIWFVQRIHYRWFHGVPEDTFTSYHQRYTTAVGGIVGPAMLVEAATGVALFVTAGDAARPWLALGAALIGLNWISTAALQIPCHMKLSHRYDAAIQHRLVTTNWIRTIAWTVRLALLIAGAETILGAE